MDKLIVKELYDDLSMLLNRCCACYSSFKVASIITTECGKRFEGVNIENSSFSLTICAERVALFNAIAKGYKKFDSLYLMW